MQHLDQRILDYEKKNYSYLNKGLQWLSSKESSCNAGDPEFNPWVGKIPWRMAWQPTLVFLPGESTWTGEPGELQSMGHRVGHD